GQPLPGTAPGRRSRMSLRSPWQSPCWNVYPLPALVAGRDEYVCTFRAARQSSSVSGGSGSGPATCNSCVAWAAGFGYDSQRNVTVPLSLLPQASPAVPYPVMLRIRQHFERPRVENVAAAVRTALERLDLGKSVRPGQTVALTAGSRGIANIPL